MPARAVPPIVLSAFMLAVPATAEAFTQRGPDAHMIRQIRGDVFVVREAETPDRYAAPVKGWAYKPVIAGQRLQPAFYAPRYVVAAPRGTKPARPPQRWVRYGDDLLLVNVRGGRIDRVVRGGYRLAYLHSTREKNSNRSTTKPR